MRLILLGLILLSSVACVGTGSRNPIAITNSQDGLSEEKKDLPKIEIAESVRIYSRENVDFNLASLYLTTYLSGKGLPAIQFYNNDEIVAEFAPADLAEFVLIPEMTTLDVTAEQVLAGNIHGISITSDKIAVGQVWSLKKTSSIANYWIIFKITDYVPSKSLRIQYKVKEFKYL